ncbi:YgaP family membrane protein [Pseudazoarcus pumilus]|uniref:DUF2892 domain-containing protein n=1 Tax=Pseudazoarcus pumilus TaxID=2067960 RepID=A0A2I6S4J7_9RHOO|nr:DUF2892 domain-containing protein [Pseudazoarcus pumilus]AUN94186.1 DUF2892 domain-containing protein [Pseudazoarcus pumilus]
MTKNVGSIDKTVRIVAGLVLIALAIMDVGAPWTWIGVLPLVTGLMGTCPAYTLFKIDTCPKD